MDHHRRRNRSRQSNKNRSKSYNEKTIEADTKKEKSTEAVPSSSGNSVEKAVPSTSKTADEEEAKLFSQKISSYVLKKTLDKKSKRVKMSTKENKSREEVVAAREAKKLAKQKAKTKEPGLSMMEVKAIFKERKKSLSESSKDGNKERKKSQCEAESRSKDEVDKAVPMDREQIKAERAAKKAAKAQKKDVAPTPMMSAPQIIEKAANSAPLYVEQDMTVKDVVETLRDIKSVANEVKEVTAKVQALDLEGKKEADVKQSETGKSKAELKAERRAKQEAQRAAKQAAAAPPPPPQAQEPAVPNKPKVTAETVTKEKSPKRKVEKVRMGAQNLCFGLEYNDSEKYLKAMPVNSNLHPAIVTLGVQLATRTVMGSNARCIALLDALKKMTKDYSLPAKTEFGRGLENHLAHSLKFLSRMRQSTASEKNAVKFFRYHLTQLPNNVNEYDAKKTLQDEIDRYIREQIEVAGEAISNDVRKKISDGDTVLTYGYSSLVERILADAFAAGVQFQIIVVGGGATAPRARDLCRRLAARNMTADYADITALGYVMHSVNLVVLGASSLLNTGAVLAAAGTAAVALSAHENNVPVLVAQETHKFSEGVQTDAFVDNELGNPDDLLPENSELRAVRSKPNVGLFNLTYDVTPPKFVTAVVTELAILPCTSAPVVFRIRGNAYTA